jgi:Ca2+-transporting ATPase
MESSMPTTAVGSREPGRRTMPDPASDWHALGSGEVLSAWGSEPERGLSQSQARERRARFGPNALPEPKRRSLLSLLLHQFQSPLIYLLLVAAVTALAVGEVVDALAIVGVVLLNAVIGTAQEGRAERALAALRRLSEHRTRVLRDGREQQIEAREVMPGDILVLAAGDSIAADARLIDRAALQVAEAALTGESVPTTKDLEPLAPDTLLAERRNMVHAGTHVTAGRARAVVVATGLATQLGQIARLAGSAAPSKTPLERRIDELGRYVMAAALLCFALVVVLGLARGLPFSEVFMIGVSQLVGMVPEGLPVALTIALAVGVQRMAARRAVVRRLSAVETLGATTVICTDKTGTLTRNEMTVTRLVLADGRQLEVTGVGYAPEGRLSLDGAAAPVAEDAALAELLEALVLCNDASLNGPVGADARYFPVGDPTEAALLTLALKAGLVPAELRRDKPRRAELPFDPASKLMATQHHAAAEGATVIIKGAPEEVLALCGSVRQGGGVGVLDDRARAELRNAAQALAEQALRVLAVAVVPGADIEAAAGFAAFRGRACLLGYVGQIDPPRPEAGEAVARAQAAGIRCVMVTGDHKATGLAIARELGIARTGDRAVDGRELERMSEPELRTDAERIAVFARVHPAQKLRIVSALQANGHVVAMTGDGVNDAPALVRADVGVAMGITGTDVAKDAAKVVVTDDNFATLVAAVEEGRVVHRNIKKVILLLFSTSLAEVIVLTLALALGYRPPLLAVQILWNNLVTEGVITVNLIMDPAEGDEMHRPPVRPDESLLTPALWRRMALMVPCIAALTLGWYVLRTGQGVAEQQVRTETFTLLAICEWFNVLNCRSETRSAFDRSLLRNPWLAVGLLVGNLLQAAVVFWTPLAQFFHTTPLGAREVVLLGLVGSTVLWVEELRKLAARHRLGAAARLSRA